MIASETMPDDGTDHHAVNMGDVLAEIARRQLADIHPLESLEVKLDRLVDDGVAEHNELLKEMNKDITKVQEKVIWYPLCALSRGARRVKVCLLGYGLVREASGVSLTYLQAFRLL
jgi:hypothetical protein